MSAYSSVLLLHSYLRWAVLALLVVVLVRAVHGLRTRRDWSRVDELLHIALLKTAYVQFLLGLILYLVLSPFSSAFFADVRVGMKQPVFRFFGLEHVLGMVCAVGVLHEGRKASLRAETAAQRQQRVWLTSLAALLLICISIPWPFLPYGRPLFRAVPLSGRTTAVPAQPLAATPGARLVTALGAGACAW